MANDIYDALAGDLGAYESYLVDDPFYVASQSIKRAQLQPTTNTEALLMPFLQGALSGGLGGYGASRAKDEMYEDYKKSALLKSLAGIEDANGVISGVRDAYGAEERPEDWSPEKAKQGLVLAALAGQHEKAKEAKKQEFMDKIRELTATEYIKADIKNQFENGGGTNPLLDGVPTNMRDAATKELPFAAKRERIGSIIDKEFSRAKDVNSIAAYFPFTGDAKNLNGLRENLSMQVQALTGKEMSDPSNARFRELLPTRNDTEKDIDMKWERFKEQLKGLATETPILDKFNPGVGAQVVNISSPPRYKASDLLKQGYVRTADGYVKK